MIALRTLAGALVFLLFLAGLYAWLLVISALVS